MSKFWVLGIAAIMFLFLASGALADSCSLVVLGTNTISVNEGSSATTTFTVRNDNNGDFVISSLGVYFNNSLISSGSVQYNSTVPAHTTGNITVNVNSGYVTANTSVVGTLSVNGSINGYGTCYSTTIGLKDFNVNIYETGSTGTYTSTTACDDLDIQVRDFYVNENQETQQTFYIKNNGVLRFEVLEAKLTSNGVTLSDYYNEKYAFSGELADIVVKAVAPNVTEDKTYSNTLQVRGMFSDGRTCAFNNIKDKNFSVLVKNKGAAFFSNCGNLKIDVPGTISADNAGVVPFTITTGTDKPATIYVESELDVSPTIIVLPENTSISRTVSFITNVPSAHMTFRPVIEGCSLASTDVVVRNTAQGDLSSVTMTTSVVQDANASFAKIIVEINNPTSKVFTGLLQVDAPAGWKAEDRQFVIVPGKSTAEIRLDRVANNAVAGNGKVKFTADGKTITADFGPSAGENAFAGLFGLGTVAGGLIALILIIIIAAILVVGIVRNSHPAEKETSQVDDWEKGQYSD